jgi:hypothetical protein
LADRGVPLAEDRVEPRDQLLALGLHVDRVLGLELPEDLLGQHVVDRALLGPAAGHVGRRVGPHLHEDAVAEGDVEGRDQVVVELADPLEGRRGEGVLGPGPLGQAGELARRQAHRRGRARRPPRLRPRVQVHHHRAVVDLVRDGEGRVVVVRRPQEPDVRRQGDPPVRHLAGVAGGPGGRDGQLARPARGQLEQGEELGEVVLDPGDVELVEDDHEDPVGEGRLVEPLEDRGLAEAPREFVVVAQQVAPLLPHRLDGDDRGRHADEAPEGDREGGLAGPRHPLEDHGLADGEGGDEPHHVLPGVVEGRGGARHEVAEPLAEGGEVEAGRVGRLALEVRGVGPVEVEELGEAGLLSLLIGLSPFSLALTFEFVLLF